MPIRRLDPILVDRIAAGEVVERPASALKELIENALDAGAWRIDVAMEDGGRKLIRVIDDGCGMDDADLALAVERHATSKIPDGDLAHIATLGFRGEALPSIAAVASLSIETRPSGGDHGFSLRVEAGEKRPLRASNWPRGTKIEVRDLFAATPARLKFLKSERSETTAIVDVMKRLAMAHPQVRFHFANNGNDLFDFPPCGDDGSSRARRIAQVLGEEFAANAIEIEAERAGFRLTGLAGLPTFNRANAQMQYVYVNGRPIRDKLFAGAIRAAYLDFLSHDRHPAVVLFVDCDFAAVDVNVHPAKAEVRFADPGLVRGLVVGALKEALAAASHQRAPRSTFSRRARTITQSRRLCGATIGVPRLLLTGTRAVHPMRRRALRKARKRLSSRARPQRTRALMKPTRRCISRRRLAPRALNFTRPTFSRKRETALSSSISTRRMSGSSMSG
jgi:DNA mismatch repair protein MutL